MPDKAKINKFLTEYFGKCWHEWHNVAPFKWYCPLCKLDGLQVHYYDPPPGNNNFFTPDGFFELIKLMKEKGKWDEFFDEHGLQSGFVKGKLLDEYYINPATFAPAVAKFLGYKEGDEN